MDLVRENHNPHDANSILVSKTPTPKIIGHLERGVAAAVAKILDLKLPTIRLKR